MTRRRQQRLVLAFVVFHCVLIVRGATQFTPRGRPATRDHILDIYAGWTGANNSYGFFSPRISPRITARATLHLETQEREIRLVRVVEAFDFRVTSLLSWFIQMDADGLLTRVLAAYWLGREPRAARVDITLSQYVVPSMEEWQRGSRAVEVEVRHATCARSGHE
jgi:hypothetical protein